MSFRSPTGLERSSLTERSRAKQRKRTTCGPPGVLRRSARWDALECLPETIVGVLIDPQFEISSRALEFGDGAELYAQKEVARALRKLAAAKSKELDQDFGGEDCLLAAADDNANRPSSQVITPTLYIWTDPAKIPRRQWIYKPYYIRKFAGSTVATGGAGKSSLLLVEAVAMASGKDLLGVQPEPGLRVWYWNGEDPQDELQRRVQAIFKHYDITGLRHRRTPVP